MMKDLDFGIVRAVDVGYRNTKWIEHAERNTLQCQLFPSIAPLASEQNLGLDKQTKRDTVVVPVGEHQYEVGPDAHLAQSINESRNLDDNYIHSDQYLALIRGALRLMRQPVIDLLMVGLPLSLFRVRKRELEKKLEGIHSLGQGKQCDVKKVCVMAQPVAAFLSCSISSVNRDQMLAERNLVIEPGWGTFDWVVTDGLKILDKRSDAAHKGMFYVVDAIARAIGNDLKIRLKSPDLERIDKAIRTRTPLKICGNEIDLSPYLVLGEHVADEAVTQLRTLVQDGSDIDNFITAGGAAFFYLDAIRRAYPRHHIELAKNPIFEVVKGLQIAGMELRAAEIKRRQSKTMNIERV